MSYTIEFTGPQQQPDRQQQQQPQIMQVTPGMESIHHAQAKNIETISKINEVNIEAARLNLKLIEANVIKAQSEAREAQIKAKRAEFTYLTECLAELKSAMTAPKLVPVTGVGSERNFQLEAAFNDKEMECLTTSYLDLYTKLQNFALEVPKWVNEHERGKK
jgi:hypothetical protein